MTPTSWKQKGEEEPERDVAEEKNLAEEDPEKGSGRTWRGTRSRGARGR